MVRMNGDRSPKIPEAEKQEAENYEDHRKLRGEDCVKTEKGRGGRKCREKANNKDQIENI